MIECKECNGSGFIEFKLNPSFVDGSIKTGKIKCQCAKSNKYPEWDVNTHYMHGDWVMYGGSEAMIPADGIGYSPIVPRFLENGNMMIGDVEYVLAPEVDFDITQHVLSDSQWQYSEETTKDDLCLYHAWDDIDLSLNKADAIAHAKHFKLTPEDLL